MFQVQQKEDGIFISQDKYVAEILKKFDFATVKTASTPIETNKALVKDEEAEAVDVHLYRSMIGSLMYLTASRPDIMFAVCACARFQVTPKTSHIHAVKRIFRYLKGQPKLGLWYPRDSPFDLEAFSDSDYAGASLDRKSTTGGCQFLGRRLISWQCKKQTIVANSTTKAEYVAAANCCGQVLWIQNQMLDYGFNFMNTKIYIDNESTICIVKNPVFHSKTKHIEIRHHFIRDSYEKKLIQVIKIHTDHNVADLLTKAFDVSRLDERECNIKQQWVKDETVYKEWEDRMERGTDSGSGPRCQVTILGGAEAQTRFEAASKQSNDPPLLRANTLGSGEDIMKLNELMELCTKLSDIISIRSDLNLEDAGGTDCLPTDTIFEELARMGHLLLLNHLHLKPRRKQRKDIEVSQSSASTEPMTEKETNEEFVPKHSYDPSQSGEDRMQLHELMNLCTKLSDRVLALETTKITQALEITSLKSRVKKLEKKASKRTHKFKRLYRVGSTRRVESSNDEGLGAQEDACKQGRSIEDIDKDAEVSLVDETQGRSDDTEMFDTYALIGDEVFAENDMTEKEHDVIPKEVSAAETLTTAGIKIPVSTAAPSTIVVSLPVITEVEITLAQTLAELKSAKSKVVMYNKACFIYGSFNHVQAQYKYHQRERMVYGNNYNRVNYNYTTKEITIISKNMVQDTQSTVRRPFQSKTTLSNKRFTHKVNTAKAQAVNTARPQAVNTARPKTVKTARPNSAVVNAVRVNQENAGKPQQDDTGFVNSRCSRHMTGNIAYLLDFKEFDGGYVTFGGGAHGGMSKEVGTPRYLSLVVPLKKVGDKAVYKELSDRMERAATTASSLEAE
ncbi:hypothetical protein Tco_0132215 [Tanacetum coccineum]